MLKAIKQYWFVLLCVWICFVVCATMYHREQAKIRTLEKETECPICRIERKAPYHAPVLIDLLTGEAGELQIYDYVKQGTELELAVAQRSGATRLFICAGVMASTDLDSHICRVQLQNTDFLINKARYCEDCRMRFVNSAESRYLLIDAYDREHLDDYSIIPGETFQVRDYQILISAEDQNRNIEVYVIGQKNIS